MIWDMEGDYGRCLIGFQIIASIALVIIIALAIAFVFSIFVGVKQTRLRAKDEVFGDPERTKGGWYWALCGVSALLLVWFYYSWGAARAVFPTAANELCQVARLRRRSPHHGGAASWLTLFKIDNAGCQECGAG